MRSCRDQSKPSLESECLAVQSETEDDLDSSSTVSSQDDGVASLIGPSYYLARPHFFWPLFAFTLSLQVVAIAIPVTVGVRACNANTAAALGGPRQLAISTLAAAINWMFLLWFMWKREKTHNPLTLQATIALFFGWARLVLLSLITSTGWCLTHVERWMSLRNLAILFWCSVNVGYTCQNQATIQLRMEVIEDSVGKLLRSTWIATMRLATVFIGLANVSFLIFAFVRSCSSLTSPHVEIDWATHVASITGIGFQATRVLSYSLIGVVVKIGLDSLIKPTHLVKQQSGYLGAEATWAGRVLRRLLFSLELNCGAAALVYALHAWMYIRFVPIHRFTGQGVPHGDLFMFRSTATMVFVAGEFLLSFLEAICLLFLVGVFTEERPDISLSHSTPPMLKTSAVQDNNAVWKQTLHGLAHRSVDAVTILEFYDQLGPKGTLMPSYVPTLSTTNDVVRQAIIPMSRTRHGGVACAFAMSNDAHLLPDVMVTHTWSGLFLHLVSVVVADALGKNEYEHVAEKLAAGDAAFLKGALCTKNASNTRYWICAFCVNQHASICGGFGRAPPVGSPQYEAWAAKCCDTVTHEFYRCCPCHQPKYFNDSPDKCEMNKFDAMIQLFREEIPTFRQAIAADEDFTVFSRAWCVAELVQGHLSGIEQIVYIHSNRVIEDFSVYRKLATLSVETCEATRPEDRREILARIPDIAEFDMQLQFLIFQEHGLLSHCFNGFDKIVAAAVAANRVSNINGRTN